MANTLSSLIPSLYESLDIVSRELVGCIPCCTLDARVERAAVGQTVYTFTSPVAVATTITPGVNPPNDGDQTIGNVALTINKAYRVPFRWNGEEELGLNNNGAGAAAIRNAQMIQAMRTLTNMIEVDCVAAAVAASSRAYGTAGTTPFASTLGDPAQVRKMLDDNGAPMGDRCMVINTSAGANLRTLAQLTKANEAGTTMTLRDGQLLDLHGFSIHESNGIAAPKTANAGTAWTTSAATAAIGTVSFVVTGGTGYFDTGEIVTFAADTAHNYVVLSGASAGGTIVLQAPGVLKAIPSTNAITIVGTATHNVAFSSSSLILATRAPALPQGGDLAIDRVMITDHRSGLSFEVAMYPQYRQMQYEMSIVWGVTGIKPAHCVQLLG